MPKAENTKQVATAAQRRLASELTAARKHAKEWGEVEKDKKESLRDSLDGRVDITLETKNGEEVASITESDPSIGYDWKQYFEDHPEHKKVLESKYAKPATTSVTILTKWTEQASPQARRSKAS